MLFYFGNTMKDDKKTKAQLIDEIAALRREVSGLKASAKKRKRAEKKPRDNEGRLKMITDTIQDAVIMMDEQGKFSFWNPAAEKIFGYTKQEAIGKGFLHVFPQEKRPREKIPGPLIRGRSLDQRMDRPSSHSRTAAMGTTWQWWLAGPRITTMPHTRPSAS